MTDLLDPEDAAKALRHGLRAGAEWVEIFVERRDSQTVRLDGGSIAEIRSDIDAGAGIRAIVGEQSGFAYTNVLSLGGLLTAVEAAVGAAAFGGLSANGNARVDLRQTDVPARQRTAHPNEQFEAASTIDTLRRIDAAARSRGAEVGNVSVTEVATAQEISVATSDGRLLNDQRVRTRMACRVTAHRDGKLETGFCGPGVGAGIELYEQWMPEAIGGQAADRALTALIGQTPPGDAPPVVLGPSGGGLLLHEACGHGLEADGLTRKSSIYATSAGKEVANPLVTAIDDPSIDMEYGSYAIDDEGTVAEPTLLIEAGVQVGAITDSVTARFLGQPSSGNGRRESYAHPPVPRMSNTFIKPGSDEHDAIISDIQSGVYVAALKGGDVNIATGDFAFTASEAYLIEGGTITAPLAGLTLIGNGPAALASVQAVGDDLSLTQALCGKEGQWVPVSYGSPTLLVTGLTVTGPRR
jgi:TldD protein